MNIDLYLEYLAGATGPGGMEQKADQTSIAGTPKLGLCDIEELEVLLRICDFLAPRDQANLACACRSFGGKVRWTESDTYVETCSVVEQSARRWVRSRQLQRSWLQQRHLIEHATAEVINECKNGTTTWRLKSLLKHAQLNINGVDGVDDDVRPKINALSWSAHRNNVGTMRTLLRAGADLNISAWNGATPLMIAAWNGSNEAVQWLLDQGADWRKVHPKTGKNALAMALERGHSEATSLLATWLEVHGTLEEKLRWKFYELMRAAEQGQMEEVARLLEYGDLDVNAADNRGCMVLHAAVARNDVSMMERVVKAGADINMKNGKARTPLMVAVRNDSNEAAQWLLERGADWMIQSADGEDAVQYAKQVGSSVVRLLGQWVASNPDRPQPVFHSPKWGQSCEDYNVVEEGVPPDWVDITEQPPKTAFERYDLDSNGQMDKEELRFMFSELEIPADDAYLNRVLQHYAIGHVGTDDDDDDQELVILPQGFSCLWTSIGGDTLLAHFLTKEAGSESTKTKVGVMSRTLLGRCRSTLLRA